MSVAASSARPAGAMAGSRFWAEWRTTDFAALPPDVLANMIAVLPVAATEQHGPHLPLNVDTVLLDGIVGASLHHLPAPLHVLFLPTQAVGFSPEHAAFEGTLTLGADDVIRLWTALAESVARTGVRKLVLLNSHGGQVGLLDVVARDLRARLGLLVYSVSWFNLPLGAEVDALFPPQEHRFGVHAGDVETSMMLALSPEAVDMARAANFGSSSQVRAQSLPILGNGRSAKLAWQTQDLNPCGAVGNAAVATADKGRAVVAAAGLALAQMLIELGGLPLKTCVPGRL